MRYVDSMSKAFRLPAIFCGYRTYRQTYSVDNDASYECPPAIVRIDNNNTKTSGSVIVPLRHKWNTSSADMRELCICSCADCVPETAEYAHFIYKCTVCLHSLYGRTVSAWHCAMPLHKHQIYYIYIIIILAKFVLIRVHCPHFGSVLLGRLQFHEQIFVYIIAAAVTAGGKIASHQQWNWSSFTQPRI